MSQKKVVIVGGGHNGLVCAAYLARAGFTVTVLERRELIGGACVTETLWPGYRVSRAAYVLSLLRPRIVKDLELTKHGLKLLPRVPSSITPLPDGRALVLGPDREQNAQEIRAFSAKDAERFGAYESLLERIADALEPTLDLPPPRFFPRRPRELRPWAAALRAGIKLGRHTPAAARILLGAARDLLEEWFDSEPLRSTLATDAVIGAFASPATPGTGYVLFHHVMGSITGSRGVWAYVEGGMGRLSDAIAAAAEAHGVTIRTDTNVATLRTRDGQVRGVALQDGTEIDADLVVSSIDPIRTCSILDNAEQLPDTFRRSVGALDMRSPVVKINLALDRLPDFRLRDRDQLSLSGTIHLGPTTLDEIEDAFQDAQLGQVSKKPVVEMTIPSVLDTTLAPEGRHVASIFAQYAPARAPNDPEWNSLRDQMRDNVLAVVEAAAPGFSSSILEIDVLAPPDLERIFGLTGGNIFHGAMTPDRLLFMRPLPDWANHRMPISGLYLCGSGTHPGGGVMGACGRNAALEILSDLR